MNEQITARECVKALCSAWFERRSMEETIAFLADDVMFIGTGETADRREYLQFLDRADSPYIPGGCAASLF